MTSTLPYTDDWLAPDEARCHHCQTVCLQMAMLGCVCAKYGYLGHEEVAWCSSDCLDASHPDNDRGREDDAQMSRNQED